MIQSRIENEIVEFEIHGDIPTIVCEILILVSSIHRVFLRAGKEPADEFRLGVLSMFTDPEVVAELFSKDGIKMDDHQVIIRSSGKRSRRRKPMPSSDS